MSEIVPSQCKKLLSVTMTHLDCIILHCSCFLVHPQSPSESPTLSPSMVSYNTDLQSTASCLAQVLSMGILGTLYCMNLLWQTVHVVRSLNWLIQTSNIASSYQFSSVSSRQLCRRKSCLVLDQFHSTSNEVLSFFLRTK